MTRKTSGMPDRDGFERAFLQPESVAPFIGWFRNKFFGRVTLRLIGLVANAAAFLCRQTAPSCISKLNIARTSRNDVDVLVVRELDREVRLRRLALRGRIEQFPRIRERVTRLFHFSSLKVPGLDTSAITAQFGAPKPVSGFSRIEASHKQARINAFFEQ